MQTNSPTPITKSEKLFLIKVLLNAKNMCIVLSDREKQVLKAIKKDIK